MHEARKEQLDAKMHGAMVFRSTEDVHTSAGRNDSKLIVGLNFLNFGLVCTSYSLTVITFHGWQKFCHYAVIIILLCVTKFTKFVAALKNVSVS